MARAHNARERDHDPTAHAELLALRDAARHAGTWRLSDYALVVTLEPCLMCAGAAWAARVGRIVFGAADPKAGAAGSLYNFAADPRLNHETAVVAGERAAECAELLTTFFRSRRASLIPYYLAPEGCESGRIGWSRKPLWRKSPWVQIPLPPLALRKEPWPSGRGSLSPRS